MRLSDFDFELPEDLIALRPARPRDAARLLHAPAEQDVFEDCGVLDLPNLLEPGDVLVFNDTRTIPAALKGTRKGRGPNDGRIEIPFNLHKRIDAKTWAAFARKSKRLSIGDCLEFGDQLSADVIEKSSEGEVVLSFSCAGPALDVAIAEAGVMPLPPYIASKRAVDEEDLHDYQTLHAKHDGSVATPTAGLHFTEKVLAALDARGIERLAVTLHVGAGTFLPVKVDKVADHRMHAEHWSISNDVAQRLNRAKAEGRRIIAVGTTSLRTLESAADDEGQVRAGAEDTSIFITPGYRFKVVDGLMTNFHLPKSTLIMLVSALIGLERTLALYSHAIKERYRFYSYGDASLLWRRSQL